MHLVGQEKGVRGFYVSIGARTLHWATCPMQRKGQSGKHPSVQRRVRPGKHLSVVQRVDKHLSVVQRADKHPSVQQVDKHPSVVQRVGKHRLGLHQGKHRSGEQARAPEAVASAAATIRQEQVPLPSVVVQQALDRSLVPQVSGAEA